ncbi:MAG TPA: ABC transporter permease [Catenuloplanes sp.]
MTTTTRPNPRAGTTTPHRADPGPPRSTRVSLVRLTAVELRKLADTRAGWWLLLIIGLTAAATVAILLLAGEPAEQTFADFFGFGLLPASVLLPVLGILSMTSEWSQRTALTTFALVPARGRVLVAKVAAAVLVAIAVTAVTLGTAAIGNLIAIAMDGNGAWKIEAVTVGQAALGQVIYVLMGSAFGALLLNSPLAIVLYFALPTVWTFLGELVKWLRTAAQWLDINTTALVLENPGVTGGQWARLAVSVAFWVLLPLALGTVRVLRKEIS